MSRGGASEILVAACLWGTTGTVQSFAPEGVGPVSVGAARIVVGGVLLLASARGPGLRQILAGHGARSRWTWIVVAALCVAVYQTAFFAAVSRTGVATGTVVTIGSGPVFAGLLARLCGPGRVSRRWLLSTGGAVLGAVALVSGGTAAGVEPFGVGLALVSGLAYAAYATVTSFLITQGSDHRAVVGTVFAAAALALLPVLLATAPGWMATGQGAAVVLYLGAVTTTAGYLLYGRGLRTTPVATAVTLTLAEPAVAALLGIVVLGERLGGIALGGLVLVAGSLLPLTTPSKPAETSAAG